jgi:mono/diheme cytochrome c family protein
MIRLFSALLTGAVLVFAHSVPSAVAQEKLPGIAKPFVPDPVRGLETARKLCASCHIVEESQKGAAQPGIPSFRYMANRDGQSEANLRENMIHPFPPMTDTHLTLKEIKNISAYILSLKTK